MLSRLSHKVILLVTVPVIVLLSLLFTLLTINHQMQVEREKEIEALEFQSAVNSVLVLIQRYVFWRQGSVLATGEFGASVEQRFETALHKKLSNIEKLVVNAPEQKEKFAKVMSLSRSIYSQCRATELKYRGGDRVGALLSWKTVTKRLEEFDSALTSLSEGDEKRIQEYSESMARYNNLTQYVCYAAALISVLYAIAMTAFFNKSTTSKLHVIMSNVERLAADQNLLAPLQGSDELDLIDQSFHKMNDTLAVLRRKERAILENASELICSLDGNLKFTDANAAAFPVVGYTAADLLSRRAIDLVVDEEKEMAKSRLQTVLNSESGNTSFETTIRRADGELASVAWSVSISPDERTIYAVIQDITQRKQLERIKRDFLAMVSHDIRAPLGNIQLVLSLIEEDGGPVLPKSIKRSLAIAKDNTQRLLALVNNLLDVEKIESGMLTVLPDQCALKSTVTAAVNAVEALSNQSKIKISEAIDSEIKAYFDEEKIVQVLVNLLSNAIKFSPADSVITIAAQEQGDFVRVNVTDQGRGIPEEKLSTVFERFRQVEKGDEKEKKGAGLGLTICKAIIENHGGIIGVDSQSDKGTTFWFTLPRFAKE
ncbi:MAG: PAS domain-containing sensor histidine kinase [Candidatus Obscuribacterales bacterium]|nr:PAS domain-containing sensor histidine kinase [Candidatus Obscuribacterales bacterium]